jgi:hypothetical protein
MAPMRRSAFVAVILFLAVAAFFVRRVTAQDQLDSLVVCHETQKLLFENAFVRVIDDVIPPGVSEPKHHHPHGVVVAIEDADTETRLYPDGQPGRHHTAKGAVSWNESIVHDVKNVGTTTTHFIRIDIK